MSFILGSYSPRTYLELNSSPPPYAIIGVLAGESRETKQLLQRSIPVLRMEPAREIVIDPLLNLEKNFHKYSQVLSAAQVFNPAPFTGWDGGTGLSSALVLLHQF